jgi:glycosyltransferase involved in cell wall biosynthesis
MEVAARELIPALLAQAPPNVRFTAFVNREAAAEADGPWQRPGLQVTVPVHARNRVQWVLGEQTLLPALAARARIDLMHSLASTAPLWGPFRRVVTVNDLIYARFPEAHAGLRDKGMRLLVPAAVRRSDRVIAISQSTRSDLLDRLGVAGDRVDVVPLAFSAPDRSPALDERSVRERFGLSDRRVLLALSAKRPHKNLPRLIEALALLPREQRPALVLPGYPTAHERELREQARALELEEHVRFAGWVGPEELEGLWGLADAFVFPSLYEGFGLPVLEAMARGVPVACSNSSSLPEVVGDAALLFDPLRVEEISAAIARLLDDGELAGTLVERGRRRAATFSWERTARLTLEVYARTLGPGRLLVAGEAPA